MKLTLDLPDDLQTEGLPREELAAIVEAGLRRRQLRSPLLRDLALLLERLAAAPHAHEVSEMRVSDAAEERLEYLLEKNREDRLADDERAEWEEFERMEYLVRAAKTVALSELAARG